MKILSENKPKSNSELFNLEIEKKVLAACIKYKKSRIEAFEIVHSEDFYEPRHRLIFSGLNVLHTKAPDEETIDLLLLAEYLKQYPAEYKNIVENYYLHQEVVQADAVGVYVAAHCEKLKELSRRRRVERRCQKIQTHISEWELPIIQRELLAISQELDGPAAGGDFAAKYMKCHAEEIPKPENIAWLWQPRITLGSVTVIGGNPGVGKSTIALDLAARITTGAGFPDRMPSPKGRVLLLVGEDHHRKIVSRRLEAAGADRHMVEYVEYRHLHDLDKQMGDLESCLKAKAGFKMIIIDPVSLYIGDKIEFHHQNEVAQFYGRLGDLAERFNVAILVVAHLNKNSGQETAIYRISGSSGHVSVARAVFIVTKKRNPDNPDDWCCYFIQAKNSYGPDDIAFRWWHSGDDESPCIEWDPNPILVSADDLLSGGKEPSKKENAEAWLRDALAAGPMESNRLQKMALQDGYSWTTLKRAKNSIGALARKDGFQGEWIWYLPKEDQTVETWSPLEESSKEDQPPPKKTKNCIHETWSPLGNLVPFDESGPAQVEVEI